MKKNKALAVPSLVLCISCSCLLLLNLLGRMTWEYMNVWTVLLSLLPIALFSSRIRVR